MRFRLRDLWRQMRGWGWVSYPGAGDAHEPWNVYSIAIRNGRVRLNTFGPGAPLIGPLSWALATAQRYAREIHTTPPELRMIHGGLLMECGETEWAKRKARLQGEP